LKNIFRTKIKSGASSRNRDERKKNLLLNRGSDFSSRYFKRPASAPRKDERLVATDKGRRLPVISHGVVTSAIRSH